MVSKKTDGGKMSKLRNLIKKTLSEAKKKKEDYFDKRVILSLDESGGVVIDDILDSKAIESLKNIGKKAGKVKRKILGKRIDKRTHKPSAEKHMREYEFRRDEIPF